MLSVKQVHAAELREQVYALRYRAYLHEGAIDPTPSESFSDHYDRQPNHVLWALFDAGVLVGSIRSTWYDPGSAWSIPERDCYGDCLDRHIPAEARLISGNRFVTEPHRPQQSDRYAMQLLRHHLTLAAPLSDYGVAAVRANHLRFYRRVLKMERGSEARVCPGLKCAMHLILAETRRTMELIYRDAPCLRPPQEMDEAAA